MALPWPISMLGQLYLTNQRLIWVRDDFNFPFGVGPSSWITELPAIKWVTLTKRLWAGQWLVFEDQSAVRFMHGLERFGPLRLWSYQASADWLHAIQAVSGPQMPSMPISQSPAISIGRLRLRRLPYVVIGLLLLLALLITLPGLWFGSWVLLMFLVYDLFFIVLAGIFWHYISNMTAPLTVIQVS